MKAKKILIKSKRRKEKPTQGVVKFNSFKVKAKPRLWTNGY